MAMHEWYHVKKKIKKMYNAYHVPGGAVPVWEPMLGLLGTAPNLNRVEHDQGGERVDISAEAHTSLDWDCVYII